MFALIFFLSGISKAQIGRNEWSLGPVIQNDNIVYSPIIGNLLTTLPGLIVSFADEDAIEDVNRFYNKNIWWIPTFRYRANIAQKLSVGDTKYILYPKAWGFSGMDWSYDTYAIGYHVGYLSRIFPLGFDVQLDYAQDAYKYKIGDSDIKEKMVKRSLAATALLKIRFLKYDSNAFNPVIELGGAYNHVLYYRDHLIKDRDAVNNGFSGIIGIGYTATDSHWSWLLRYEHAFYDFYNKDFVYNGQEIFRDSKSTFGRLSIALTYGF